MRHLIFFVIACLLIGGVSSILSAESKDYTPAPFDMGKSQGMSKSGIFDDLYVKDSTFLNTVIDSGNHVVLGDLTVSGETNLGDAVTDTVTCTGYLTLPNDTILGDVVVKGAVKPGVVISNLMYNTSSISIIKNSFGHIYSSFNVFVGEDSIQVDSMKCYFSFAAGAAADSVVMDSVHIELFSSFTGHALGTVLWGDGTDVTRTGVGHVLKTYNNINTMLSPLDNYRLKFLGTKMAANGDITIWDIVWFCHYK